MCKGILGSILPVASAVSVVAYVCTADLYSSVVSLTVLTVTVCFCKIQKRPKEEKYLLKCVLKTIYTVYIN